MWIKSADNSRYSIIRIEIEKTSIVTAVCTVRGYSAVTNWRGGDGGFGGGGGGLLLEAGVGNHAQAKR